MAKIKRSMLSFWSSRYEAKNGRQPDGPRVRSAHKVPLRLSRRATIDPSCVGWMVCGRSIRCESSIVFQWHSPDNEEPSVKAIIYWRYGGPEVLELAEVPEPKLAQNGVLIGVKAAA